MKYLSKKLKKNSKEKECKTVWENSYREMRNQTAKLESDLTVLAREFDNDAELTIALGRTGTPLTDDIEKGSSELRKLEDNLYMAISRMKSLVSEIKRGVNRSDQEMIGLVEEVFGFFEWAKTQTLEDLVFFSKDHNRLLEHLIRRVKGVDNVRGFDLEGLDIELLVNYEGFEGIVGQEEQDMLNNYSRALDVLEETKNLELEVLRTKDLEDPFDCMEDKLKEAFRHFERVCVERKKRGIFLYTIMAKVFPKIKKTELETYESYLKHQKYQKQRKRAVVRTFLRGQKDLKLKVEMLIQENLLQKLKKLKFSEDCLHRQEKAVELKKELEERRKKYTRIRLEVERKQRLREERERKELELKEQKFVRHAEVIRKKAVLIKEKKKKEEETKQRKELKRMEREHMNMDRNIKLKMPLVQKRQRKAERKVMCNFVANENRKNAVSSRNERIKQIIDGYSWRPKVKPDFNRMRGDTEVLKHRREAEETKPLFSNPSFQDSHLMKDKRFQLSTALYEAGLQGNAYGRAVLTKMGPTNIHHFN